MKQTAKNCVRLVMHEYKTENKTYLKKRISGKTARRKTCK